MELPVELSWINRYYEDTRIESFCGGQAYDTAQISLITTLEN